MYDLEEESLWLDECFTLDYASKSSAALIDTLKKDVHPIGYYLPQHLLIGYLGASEFSLRLLSVFFGVLSVFLTYILARKLFSWKEGLLASFFVSISYTSTFYSQEAKMYSMFAAFFLLSLFYFVKLLEKPSYLNLLFFSISSALLLHTHIIGIVIFLGYILFYVTTYVLMQKGMFNVSTKKATFSSRFFLAQLIVLILYFLWLKILIIYQLPLLYTFLGAKLIEKLGFNLLPLVVVGAVILVIAYFIVLYLIITDKINLQRIFAILKQFFSFFSYEAVLFLLLLLISVVDFIFSTYLFSSVGVIRFCFFILPFLYILLSRVLLRMKSTYLANLLFIFLILSASFELYTYYHVDSKEQFREAADYIETHASAADVLFLHRATITKQCFDYYYSGNVEEVRLIVPGKDDHLLIERASGKKDIYLLLSHNYHTGDYFKSHLDSLYELKEEKKFIGITIYKYDISES